MYSPGALIVENVVLVAGSPTAFADRYGHVLTTTSFAKPGANVQAANAILHFLVCAIDPDASASFKPCFPILDRQQERDFRRVVDARLALLENAKLIPAGTARKSVILSGGGDKFLDLLWSLSVLAVQQACVRQPAYGSASRIRLMSHSGRTDSNLTHQSSARSTRSLLSSSTKTADRADSTRQQRRFLGAGMVSAAQQRSKDAEEMRARINAERATLARTTQAGQAGAKTWATEADSLREKIGDFEAKIRRLKGQLADMGFDQHGVDIRTTADANLESGQMTQSSSGDDLRGLKTSPIESMESGSSVDELIEPTDNVGIVSDFPKLMAFTAGAPETRSDVECALPPEKVIPTPKEESIESQTSQPLPPVHANPEDIVVLVRAATDELEQATNRMGEIQEACKKAAQNTLTSTVSQSQPPFASSGSKAPAPGKSLKELIESSVQRQSNIVQSAKSLSNAAIELTQKSQQMKRLPRDESNDSLRTIDPVANISKPTWVSEATADASNNSLIDLVGLSSADGSKCSSADEIDTARDVNVVTQALQNPSPRRTQSTASSGSSGRRLRESRRSSERRQQRNRATRKPTPLASREQVTNLYANVTPLAAKNSRSVRFAALPPSYSANRSDFPGGLGVGRHPAEVFPSPARLQRMVDGDKIAEAVPLSRRYSDADVADGGKASARARRSEQTESSVRRGGTYSPKSEHHRRTSSVDEKVGGPSPSKPSSSTTRITRTQTPRRIVRRKETLQRSFISKRQPPAAQIASAGSTTSTDDGEVQPEASKQITKEDKDSLSTAASLGTQMARECEPAITPAPAGTEVECSDDLKIDVATKTEEVPAGTTGSVSGENPTPEKKSCPPQSHSVNNALEVESKATVDQTPRPSEVNTVPKRLFMTPETPATSVSASGNSSTLSKKPVFALRSLGSVLGRKQMLRTASTDSGSSEPKIHPSASDDDLILSPHPRTSTAAKLSQTARSADGFFAGQTAQQWQVSAVQRPSSAPHPEKPGKRLDPNSSFLNSKGRGHSTTSSSARKSRVQNFKARLAAALK